MASYTNTLRGLTTGQGTSYPWSAMPKGHGTAARQALVGSLLGGARPAGVDRVEAGSLTFQCRLTGASETAIQDRRDELVAAWSASGLDGLEELTMELAEGARVFRGRPLEVDVNLDQIVRGRQGAARCVFTLFDPLWYSATSRSVSVAVAGASGGMDTPMVTPMVTTGTGSTGDASVVNTGTAPAEWTAVLAGPLTTPRLILGGQTVQVDGTLAADETAVIDSREGLVTVGGQARPWVSFSSRWWMIPPGLSTFSFRAAAGTGTATLTWRDASF